MRAPPKRACSRPLACVRGAPGLEAHNAHSPSRRIPPPPPSSSHSRADGHVVGIAAGSNHSLAVTRSGKVFQFGGRVFLQPSPVATGYYKPAGAAKEQSQRLHAVSVAAGEGVSALVDATGHLFTWGKNLNTGMLGHRGYGMGTNLPVRVEALVGLPVAHVSLGTKHAAAVIGAAPGGAGSSAAGAGGALR